MSGAADFRSDRVSRAVVAMLAAIVVLAGGRLLAPPLAPAAVDQGNDCTKSWTECEWEEDKSGPGGGGDSGSSGPSYEQPGEVIVIDDTGPADDPPIGSGRCGEPGAGMVCRCPDGNYAMGECGRPGGRDDGDRPREVKRKEDAAYAACLKARKKYMLPEERPLCPVYCPDQHRYRFDGCASATMLPNSKEKRAGRRTLEQYMGDVRFCDRVGRERAKVEGRLKWLAADPPPNRDIALREKHALDRVLEKDELAWGMYGCDEVYAPSM